MLVHVHGTHRSGEFNHNKATTSRICKSLSLHYSDSTKFELEPGLLKVKRTGRVSD